MLRNSLKCLNRFVLSLAALLVVSASLQADPMIPYPTPGVVAPANVFSGMGGDVIAYYYGSTAAYSSNLAMYVNGVLSSAGWVFPNHDTAPGTSINLGFAGVGDTIVFALQVFGFNPVVLDPAPNPHYIGSAIYTLYSDPALNAIDGLNHVYTTAYPGMGNPLVPGIPAGTYVAFEDLIGLPPDSDLNYNDHDFVFTNIHASDTPEPTSMALLGTIVLAGGVGYRLSKKKMSA